MSAVNNNLKKIVIAGANGFVGRKLLETLSEKFSIIALTRKANSTPEEKNILWRECDLFSALDTENALLGADYAIYLVHSMMPSARLVQGNFMDMDLILADNFVRAAEKQGIKQIVYLGGITPNEELSSHLESRLEVEKTLGSRSVSLTSLRAPIVVGGNGSSFVMLKNLVARLPVMICPKWTSSKAQPVDIRDVVAAFEYCVGNEKSYNECIDLGGPEVINYKDMLLVVAKCLRKKRYLITVPIFSPRLSVLWVSLVSQTSSKLVSPLIQSLRHDMVATPHKLITEMNLPLIPFEQSVNDAIQQKNKKEKKQKSKNKSPQKSNVRSVQRLDLPQDKDARWVAEEYPRWLARKLWFLLKIDIAENGDFTIYSRFFKISLLELTLAQERSSSDRTVFYITGGILAKKDTRGRFEFREVLQRKYVLSAVHDFEPTLPWYIYSYTEAIAHLWVMHSFGKHLKRFF